MAYVYRYINLEKKEVCYIGKVTKDRDIGYEPLFNRHRQHKTEEWYKEIGDKNLLLQYFECSHTDADILETWLINYYCPTGQLVNISKANWGKSEIDLYPVFGGKWRNYGQNREYNSNEVHRMLVPLVDNLMRRTEGLEVNLDSYLNDFCNNVIVIAEDLKKTYDLSRFEMQDDFLRPATKVGNEVERMVLDE